MKLIYDNYNINLRFKENVSQVLIIESPQALQKMIYELWKQASGAEGGWVFSEGLNELSLNRNAEVIFNIFNLNLNSKKVLGKLYQEMEQLIREFCPAEISAINAGIVQVFDKVSEQLPYILKYDLDLNLSGLIKLYNMELDYQEMSLMERICTYIRNIHQLCRVELFIFLNLKQFLSSEQLSEIYKFCYYEKVYILDVESTAVSKEETEEFTVLDKDLCLISY